MRKYFRKNLKGKKVTTITEFSKKKNIKKEKATVV